MRNLEIKNIKSHPSQSLAKANASRDLQINFNQAEDPLTISTKSRGDNKCGSATQSGRSMIEMLGVLAIIGVLSVGGIAGYSKAMLRYKVNKSIEQVSLISQNVRSFFASQKDGYKDLDSSGLHYQGGLTLIKKAKLVPEEMIDENNSIRDSDWDLPHHIFNPFGGGVVVWNDSQGNNIDSCKYFQIVYFRLSQEACIELATQDWLSSAMGLTTLSMYNLGYVDAGVADECIRNPSGRRISNSNHAYAYACPNGTTVPIPVPLDIAVDACNCPNNDCTIVWGFK